MNSKLGLFLLSLLFGGAVTWIGLSELTRRYSAYLDGPAAGDDMVADLHGDVNIRRRAVERKHDRAEDARRREENWDGVKEYAKGVVP